MDRTGGLETMKETRNVGTETNESKHTLSRIL